MKKIFFYTVLIKNTGEKSAKLLSRHWIIKDDNGKIQDVKGKGVIGEQPDIQPGEEFQYTSGTMIETARNYEGSYHMIDDEDNYFVLKYQSLSYVQESFIELYTLNKKICF